MTESRIKGGLKAVETIKKIHGDDFYHRIGKLGGASKHSPNSKAGFGNMTPELRREYARRGGLSGRGKTKVRTIE